MNIRLLKKVGENVGGKVAETLPKTSLKHVANVSTAWT
jgi:hypothetical protein